MIRHCQEIQLIAKRSLDQKLIPLKIPEQKSWFFKANKVHSSGAITASTLSQNYYPYFFLFTFFCLPELLNPYFVVGGFEGFRHKNHPFFIQEISIFRPNYQNTLLLRSRFDAQLIPWDAKKNFHLVTRHLHGFHWKSATRDYSFLFTCFGCLKIRFP